MMANIFAELDSSSYADAGMMSELILAYQMMICRRGVHKTQRSQGLIHSFVYSIFLPLPKDLNVEFLCLINTKNTKPETPLNVS